jgi:hypothetical protein
VQFLYDEQYSDRCYLQHGVSLAPGATVIDVGANIGMFSMFAAEVSHRHQHHAALTCLQQAAVDHNLLLAAAELASCPKHLPPAMHLELIDCCLHTQRAFSATKPMQAPVFTPLLRRLSAQQVLC